MIAEARIWLAALDPRIWQAVVAGLFVALGWVVNGWQTRRHATRLRRERVNDVQRALYAEIRAYVAVLERDEPGTYSTALAAKIRSDAGYFPIIPHERNRTIFDAVVSDIHILPRAVIDPVALYYSQLVAIETLIDDLRTLDKGAVGPERAARMYEDYIALKVEALDLGRDAMAMMGGYLSGGRDRVSQIEAARLAEDQARLAAAVPMLKSDLAAMAARINSPGAGRSVR